MNQEEDIGPPKKLRKNTELQLRSTFEQGGAGEVPVDQQHARVTASAILPHFGRSVIAGEVRTYGHYALRVGLDPTRDGHKIGQAMHVIGAACVFKGIPVAPLHFVKQASNAWRRVFMSDALEARDILPHYDTLLIAARVYRYGESEFEKVESAIDTFVKQGSIDSYSFSPHHLWHLALTLKPKGCSETYFDRALGVYRTIIEDERRRRLAK